MPRKKERKEPQVGKSFTKVYKGKSYAMKVIRNGSEVAYTVDGDIFATPTAAAKSITDTDVNGWKFWAMD